MRNQNFKIDKAEIVGVQPWNLPQVVGSEAILGPAHGNPLSKVTLLLRHAVVGGKHPVDDFRKLL